MIVKYCIKNNRIYLSVRSIFNNHTEEHKIKENKNNKIFILYIKFLFLVTIIAQQ